MKDEEGIYEAMYKAEKLLAHRLMDSLNRVEADLFRYSNQVNDFKRKPLISRIICAIKNEL